MSSLKVQFRCHFDGCSKSFKRKDRLDVHLRTHTGERPFVCAVEDCGKSYARSQHLYRHINKAHVSEKTNRVKCPHCNLEFASSDILKRHENRFHEITEDVKTYKCSEDGCTEVFRKKQQLVSHREKVHVLHLGLATRFHKCPHEDCDQSFIYPGLLRRHMKIHQGYKCDLEGCEEVLPTWTKLRKHKAEEHGPDLKCNTCSSVFKSKSNLKQHLQIHTKKEPIVCPRDDCSRTFLYKKNLIQHIRAFHEGKAVFIKKKRPEESAKKKRSMPKKSSAAWLSGLDDRSKGLKVLPQSHDLAMTEIAMPASTDFLPLPSASSTAQPQPGADPILTSDPEPVLTMQSPALVEEQPLGRQSPDNFSKMKYSFIHTQEALILPVNDVSCR